MTQSFLSSVHNVKSPIHKLLKTIEESDVAVFCFTDYWTFDGYIQFNRFLESNSLFCSKTILPGMELRIEAPVDYRLNIQVILSNMLTEEQLNDFKSNLKIRSIKRRISDEAIVQFAQSLDASKAKKHGFRNPQKLNKEDLLRLGSRTIEVTKSSFTEAIQAVPLGSVYILLPYDTSDGLEKLDWETQPHADNYFMRSAHVFESRNEDVTNLFLGIETDKNRHFIENFQKTLNYEEKPVICGSDAHRFSDYGNFPGNRITWIKADPTFRGFSQIFFEPRERVRIQALQPEEKTPYLVIDKVRFIDKTGDNIFPTDWIEFNENLNTVIGGKSSGKSLLLYHIAKTIAPDLVEKRSQEMTIPHYHFGGAEDFDFEVMWKDGHIDRLFVNNENSNREIEFIPQMYINTLAEEKGKGSLFRLIESILEQNSEYRNFVQKVNQEITTLEDNIEQALRELLRLRDEIQILYSERREIGTEPAILGEIQRLSSDMDTLRKESDFSLEDEQEYESLRKSKRILIERQKKYGSLNKAIDDLVATSQKFQNQVREVLETSSSMFGSDNFSMRIISSLSTNSAEQIKNTLTTIIKFHKSIADKAYDKVTRFEDQVKRLDKQLKPFEEKIQDQNRLEAFTKKLINEQEKLTAYKEKTSRIEIVKESGLKTRKNLLKHYSDLLGNYQKIVNNLQKEEYSNIDKEIVLESFLRFDTDLFLNCFTNLFDRRSKLRPIFGTFFDEYNDFHFEKETHLETVKSIYDALSDKRIKFKDKTTVNDAIQQLFKNYFQIEYNIRYKNDDILDMSPGKRGLVLLQLLLHISNATHPILIDQPEDNLDNRTISNELRRFIKEKKLARQIIIVTHDANLVVLTDAENIIVSNQAGQQSDWENAKYRFEHITGALEHSFRKSGDHALGILFSCGIREHVCDVLEGGEEAFRKREQRYGFSVH